MALASVRVGTAMGSWGLNPGTDARSGALPLLYRRLSARQQGGLPQTTVMLSSAAMADQRALDAIARIERALARIESAATRAQAAAKSGAAGSEEMDRLQGAHQALRSRVEGAIGRIDRMLETGVGG